MIFILTIGVFSIINTEMGVIGILPLLAERFGVNIPQAGLLISLFALAVAFSGPVMPLLFSGMERKKVMLLVLGLFALGNIAGMCTDNFAVALAARVLPAFLHPVYCSLAFSVAGASVPEKDRLKAVAKVIVGVSAGMVLGVPISSFVAANFSLDAAMAVFAVGNLLAFAATLVFVPRLPVQGRASCKEQLVLLKRPVLWLSIAGIIFMNGAVFGVFGFYSGYLEQITHLSWNNISAVLFIYGYLEQITHLSWNNISAVLFIYGCANILGNIIGGRLLTKAPLRTAALFAPALAAVYMAVYFTGAYAPAVVALTLVWGIIGGINVNINQYWITSAAPEAPDFANGLFLTAANLGTTFGTMLCGEIIASLGMGSMVFGGIIFLALCFAFVCARIYAGRPAGNLQRA